MRREAACLRIQKDARKYIARRSYGFLCVSAVSIQAGLRGMASRNELQFRKRKKAAVFIQVIEGLCTVFSEFLHTISEPDFYPDLVQHYDN